MLPALRVQRNSTRRRSQKYDSVTSALSALTIRQKKIPDSRFFDFFFFLLNNIAVLFGFLNRNLSLKVQEKNRKLLKESPVLHFIMATTKIRSDSYDLRLAESIQDLLSALRIRQSVFIEEQKYEQGVEIDE